MRLSCLPTPYPRCTIRSDRLEAEMTVNPREGDFPKRRLWTREEYYRAGDLGIFRPDERLELIGGTVLKKPDQTPPHAAAISLAAQAIRSRLQSNIQVRIRQPLSIGENSDPE